MRNRILALVILLLSVTAGADDFQFIQGLRDTEYKYFESDVLGRGFHIYVMLPEAYGEDPDRSYRTIYVLDGGWLLPLISGQYRYLRFTDETEEMILVAISYGAVSFEGGNYRSTDYTAPSEERDYWGGAQQFQTFLADELQPWVELSFRSNPNRRLIMGHSLGGQFVLYTAQTRPDLFNGHIASNPALHRNVEFYLELPAPEKSESMLFVGNGTANDEIYQAPMRQWEERWSGAEDRPWQLKVSALVDHTHVSSPAAAFWRALNWFQMTESSR